MGYCPLDIMMKTLQVLLLVAATTFALACGYSSKTTPPVAGSVPHIDELAPDNVNAGGADFVLTINGSKFNNDASVKWNGAARTTTFVSASQLMVTITAADIAAAGAMPVTVTNPGHAGTGQYGSGGTLTEVSNSVDFTIN